MNKKGNIGFLLAFLIVVGLLLSVGLFFSIGGAAVNLVFDTFVPAIQEIGVVGSANMTEIADYSLVPLNTVVQSWTWMGGVMYFLSIVLLFGFAVAGRMTSSKWLIGFYLAVAFLLIIGSIFISNIYEGIYDDDGDFGDRLKEQVMLSYLILHSPIIFSVLIFISGIILFSGIGEEGFI